MSSSANLVAGYIYAHQNDDGFEASCEIAVGLAICVVSPNLARRRRRPIPSPLLSASFSDGSITNYILQTPCIRRMDNRYHSFSPEVCARSEQPHTLWSATDPPEYESLPRPAPFPTRLMFWKPIHCDPKFFLRDAYSLLARIEEETGISIECDDTGDGIFIEGLDVSHVQVAEEKLATLDLCMVCLKIARCHVFRC